ncbi:MAG: phosphonate C-P lyase system protein PhnH [Burkholderiales bacterium]
MIAAPDLATVATGFERPVFAAQATFRALLDAFARPGTVRDVRAEHDAPRGLDDAMAAIMLTLLDRDTSIWLSPSLRSNAVESFIRFHTGAPRVRDPRDASFAFIGSDDAVPELGSFAVGTDDAPEHSTTVYVSVTSLDGAKNWAARGPGIDGTIRLGAFRANDPSFPATFLAQWTVNHHRFPAGVDLVFTNGRALCGLPRTTHIVAA